LSYRGIAPARRHRRSVNLGHYRQTPGSFQ